MSRSFKQPVPLSNEDSQIAIAVLESFNEIRVKPSQQSRSKRPKLIPRCVHVEALIEMLREGKSGERMCEFCARLGRRGFKDSDDAAFERHVRKTLHDLSHILHEWQELGAEAESRSAVRVRLDPRCAIQVERIASLEKSRDERPVQVLTPLFGEVRRLEVGDTPEALEHGIIQANVLLSEGWRLLSVVSRGQTGTCAFVFGR